MAISSDYTGQTFVAFTDISGFKAMMSKDNESETRKLYPNECRILREGLPGSVTSDQIQALAIARGRIREEDRHIYFEWMKRQ